MDAFDTLSPAKADRGAASRQKSCNACVRGKRRCDKKTPRCTRCGAKGLDCIYQRMPPSSGSSSSSSALSPTLPSAQLHQPSLNTPTLPDMVDFDMGGFDMESLSAGTDTSPESLQNDLTLTLDPALDFSIEYFMAGSGAADAGQLWSLPPSYGYEGSKLEIPPVPTPPRLPIRDVSLYRRSDACQESPKFDLQHAHDPNTSLGYMVQIVRDLHVGFAKTLTLPFMHARLWTSAVPATMTSAFSAATANVNCTGQNKGWTYKLIMDAGHAVVREGHEAVTPAEKLARTQAMLVVNSIRTFSGDLTLKAAADKERSTLLAWMKELVNLQIESGEKQDDLACREKPPKTWEDWVLAESIRRTRWVCFAYVCLTAILSGDLGTIMDEPFCRDAAFTASRHLWDASSSVDFYRAWRDKPMFCIKDMSFTEFWQHAQPDDMDEFTKSMFAVQAGPDLMREFMQGPCAASVC
ncbi:hypothetical protein B0I35DRAFT_475226 [Stachybotrys elegans]|uniref:Zn(2)-C6 fungal-type domain-containing protein n=1 Tax=Stachybotrys elegans TaxID=80388 RepID=A0A8K0WWK3_9HYPO|nr:hypothetical protein B0I35DRAFT_475226 [Stachybotrys elegans]